MSINRLRRYLGAAAALSLLATAGITIAVPAQPAAAVPCNPDVNPNCPPDPPPVTYSSTLTVTAPSFGTIIGQSGGTEVIHCSAGGGTCTHTDHQSSSDGRPTDGWPSYTFSYDPSPSTGYLANWSGACVGTGACSVTNDGSETLSVTPQDVQAPTVAPTPSGRVSSATVFHANASDNAVVASYGWWVCPVNSGCGPIRGSQSTFSLPSGLAPGNYVVMAKATDTSGLQTFGSANVTYVAGVDMTSSDLPAFAEHPSFTFHSTNEEEHVAADSEHRTCRAIPDGGTTPAWGACTTDNSYAPTGLADGGYTLQAEEIDDLNLVGTVSHHVVVDTEAPVVTVTGGPADGATIATATAGYPFTVSDAEPTTVSCAVDGTPVSCSSELDLAAVQDGTFHLTITATDGLGHATTVNRAVTVHVPTMLTPAASTVHSTYGHAAPLSVHVAPAGTTGHVRFTSGGHLLCTATVTAGKATCAAPASLAAGPHAVTAAYSGNFAASTAALTLTVAKAPTAIKLRLPRSVRHGGTATATISGLPRAATGLVVVSRSGHRLCSARVSGGTARCRFTAPSGKGTYPLRASYGGNGNYRGSAVAARLRVS